MHDVAAVSGGGVQRDLFCGVDEVLCSGGGGKGEGYHEAVCGDAWGAG